MNEIPDLFVEQPEPDEPEGVAAPKLKNKGGRPRGSKNRVTLKRQELLDSLNERLNETIPNAFEGDSLDFLSAVFKNPAFPLDVRVECAKQCLKFQRPSLESVEMTGANGSPLNPAQPPQFIVQFIDPEPSGDGS